MKEEAAVIKTRNLQITMILTSDFDKVKIQYLLDLVRSSEMNLMDICRWCKAQGIDFYTKFQYYRGDRFWKNLSQALRYVLLKNRLRRAKITNS